MKTFYKLTAIALVAAAFTACGGNGDSTPAATATPSATATPTATATPDTNVTATPDTNVTATPAPVNVRTILPD